MYSSIEKFYIMTKWITCKTCSFFLSNVSKGISYLRVRLLYVGYVFILPDTQDTYVTRHSNSILYRVWKECIRLLVLTTTRGEENTKVKKENPKKKANFFSLLHSSLSLQCRKLLLNCTCVRAEST